MTRDPPKPADEHGASSKKGDPTLWNSEIDAWRAGLRRFAYFACLLSPAGVMFDVHMILFSHPDASIGRVVAIRGVLVADAAVGYWATRDGRFSVPWLRAITLSMMHVSAVCFALLSLHLDGINCFYMYMISLLAFVHAVIAPERWQRAHLTYAPCVLTYLLTLGAAALVSPDVRAEWLDDRVFHKFLDQYFLVILSVVVGVLASHTVWTARRQVYQARKLGRYRLQAPIGEGGMNQVWLAWDAPLHRQVALKLLRTDGVPDTRTVQRFEREARAASRLVDPHTIRIFDFGASDDGLYYIAMEYLQGADLAALVRGHGPMPPARVVHFAAQACASLAEAHAAGVVHRDVKPQNLFVTRVGDDPDFLKLLDFGIARVSESESDAHLTQTGVVMGTPAFMAPEVCRGGHGDARSDLYALGATMYFLLAGSPPFVGPSNGHVIAAHLLETPERPSSRRGAPLPPALEDIVLRCLAKDPSQRFQSARDLAAALAQCEGAMTWTREDAGQFWQVERSAKLDRWQAPTMTTDAPK